MIIFISYWWNLFTAQTCTVIYLTQPVRYNELYLSYMYQNLSWEIQTVSLGHVLKPELHTCNKQQHLKCMRPFVSESCTVQIFQALIQPHSVQTCGMLPGTVIKLVLKLYNFQMTSSDKDFRFMATNDLMAELQKDSIKLDDDSERKVSLPCSIDKT